MITVELEGVMYCLPESAQEIPGTCTSYDPPTDPDGGCLHLRDNQRVQIEGETRQECWNGCFTSKYAPYEGKCPFVD